MTHKKRRIPAAVLALFLVLETLVGCAGRTSDPNAPLPSQAESESQETLPDLSRRRQLRVPLTIYVNNYLPTR